MIQNVLKTTDGVSPGLTGTEATITLAGFAVTYLVLLALYVYVLVRIVRAGPPDPDDLRVSTEQADAAGASEVSTDD